MELAQQAIREICEIQETFLALCTITPQSIVVNTPSDTLITAVKEVVGEEKIASLFGKIKKSTWDRMYQEYETYAKETLAELVQSDENDRTMGQIGEAWFNVMKKAIREKTIHEGMRVDGRKEDEIRKIYCEIDLFPRIHGTGLFWR